MQLFMVNGFPFVAVNAEQAARMAFSETRVEVKDDVTVARVPVTLDLSQPAGFAFGTHEKVFSRSDFSPDNEE